MVEYMAVQVGRSQTIIRYLCNACECIIRLAARLATAITLPSLGGDCSNACVKVEKAQVHKLTNGKSATALHPPSLPPFPLITKGGK